MHSRTLLSLLLCLAATGLAAPAVAQSGEAVAAGEQITDALLAKVIVGARAADRVLASGDRLHASRDAKNEKLSALVEKNLPVRQAYNDGMTGVTECRSSSLNSLAQAWGEKLQVKLAEKQSDPAYLTKMQQTSMKYAKIISDANERGDQAAVQKAQSDVMAEMVGIDIYAQMKKDTATVMAKCGKGPPMPPALQQEEALRKDVSAVDDEIRSLEEKATNQGAQSSSLGLVRYAQLKERIVAIMQKSGSSPHYADSEIAAVKKRKADLEKLQRAL